MTINTNFNPNRQEKFRPSIKHFNEIVSISSRILKTARILDIPVVVTEQYPKGILSFTVYVAESESFL
jgi:2-phosphoglycerate kinase